MPRTRITALAFLVCAWVPSTAFAEQLCGTVAEFNAAMAAAGTASTDVTLDFDVVGVNPSDFAGSKGSLAQLRNSGCAAGQDAVIKVYGPEDPPNVAHPSGTLKMEYGNACCGGTCGENWADPNASAVVFVDGSESCHVTMWMRPTETGYSLVCNVGQFDGLGANPEGNAVDAIALLDYLLPDGGHTWEIPNATASNDTVCWESVPSGMQSITVPVVEDVTAAPSSPDAVYPDITDLAVEADGTTAYLKFVVPPIDGKIAGARLLVHSSTAPSSDGDGGEVHVVADTEWSEANMTWNDRPGFEAASLGRIGPAAADVPLSLDLGTAIAGEGPIAFAIESPPTDTNGTHFWSKEGNPGGAAALQLDILVVDADGDGVNDGPDCDDSDPAVNPGASESCNGIDDDCDGDTDEGCEGVDSGSSDGGGDGATTTAGSSDGDGGSPLSAGPGFGDTDTGCGCTAAHADGQGWSALPLLLAVGVVRPRRRGRASARPPRRPAGT